MSNTTVSYGSANWTYDEIDVTDVTTISGTFKSTGTWKFVPPTDNGIRSKIWLDMKALCEGTLDLSSEELEQLLTAIERYGSELGKIHFITHR